MNQFLGFVNKAGYNGNCDVAKHDSTDNKSASNNLPTNTSNSPNLNAIPKTSALTTNGDGGKTKRNNIFIYS